MTNEEYIHRIETGSWPGDAPVPTPAPIGDNNPPAEEGVDTLEALSDRIRLELESIESWCTVPREGRIAGDTAANWITEIRKLSKRMDACHEIEKRPHLEAGRQVDERWRRPRELAERAKKLLTAIVVRIAQAEKERAREQLRARDATEEMIAQALKPDGFGGAAGNKISLKQTRVAEIHDWTIVAVHYSGNEKVRELLQKLANADARNGTKVDGAEIRIVERV